MNGQQGKVDIVGAGPGGLAYLTLAGKYLIEQAEVLIYDALIHPETLTLVAKKCLCLSVGKRGGQPSTPQSRINQLLVEYCQQGQRVVRLKSGDPFMFGRTSAEIQALQAAHCSVKVWPGLSSLLAAPLLAGIPLTDAQCSSSFAVLSGHDLENINWPAIAQLETLVIMMGTRLLSEIVDRLRLQGQSGERPVAIIRQGGWSQQRVWTGTLATIVSQVQGESLSPAVIVVGEVVTLRSSLREASAVDAAMIEAILQETRASQLLLSPLVTMSDASLPLAGQTILVTRSAAHAGDFCDRIAAAGASVLEMPALEIVPPSSWDALDRAIANLEQFHWLILTSANGVNYFLERLLAQGKDVRSLSTLKIAVVGRKTAQALEHQGLQADFMPPSYVADSLIEHFPQQKMKELKFLFPRVETGGREALVAQFTNQGASVTEVPAYQSQCPSSISSPVLWALQTQRIDAITFASSKTVQYFCQILEQAASAKGQNWLQWIENAQIVSIGPQTSLTCEQWLGRVDLEATEYTLEGLTQTLIEHYAPIETSPQTQ